MNVAPLVAQFVFVLAAAQIASAEPTVSSDWGGLAIGGSERTAAPASVRQCIPAEQRIEITRLMQNLDAGLPGGSPTPPTRRGVVPLFDFYPLGGDIYGDLHLNNYADLDPGPGVLDFDCGNHTYNGHDGQDVGLRTFDEQFIGVPIFAALAGTVVSRDDGHFDQNTSWQGQPANFVILDHSNIEPGLRTLYWHMKSGSVAPQLGESVAAGEQIGLVGSSGNSTNPHLHFEVWRNGSWVPTMVGPCNATVPMWAQPWSKPDAHYLRDFGFLRGRLPDDHEWPDPFPRDNSATLTTERIHYWTQGVHLPADSTYRFRFYTPSGALDFDSGTRPISFSANGFSRRYWATYTWNITDMRNIPGIWTVAYDINGERQLDARVTVLNTGQAYVNTPPAAVGATLEPAQPGADDVIFARLETDLVEDDFEYDLVRYRYVWTVDGVVVRDTISAGHADAIPSIIDLGFSTNALRTVSVEITPNDGVANGLATTTTIVVPALCPADTNGDGVVNPADFNAWVIAFNNQTPACDQNGDSLCNPADFNAWVINFNDGC
ncbi:MAG: M23 family metallopeptidase [Planctomycetota bacterium]